MWKMDLMRFLDVLGEVEDEERIEIEKANKKIKNVGKQRKAPKKRAKKERNSSKSWDSDEDS